MFRRAERKKAKLRLGIAGPAGSGKTFSSLKIAQGLGGRIALIDTEHGSGELYAHLCEYDVATLSSPFTPDRYTALIKEAEKSGYGTIIIDSASHAWAGEGGLLEMKDRISKTQTNGFSAWREVTPKHNAFVEAMLQSPCHIIATMRSKQEYIITTDERGKSMVKKVGLAPVQRDGMEYEFTIFFELCAEHLATATKDRTSLFKDITPFVPTEETGRVLLDWLETGNDPVLASEELKQTMVKRIARIANPFELRNWYEKHKEEIEELMPEHKAEIMSLLTEAKRRLNESRNSKEALA